MNLTAWNSLLAALGATPEETCFRELLDAYSEAHRAYHLVRHLDECLSLFAEFRSLAAEGAEVECALWFHDAIYQPMRSDNEERSAAWAGTYLAARGVQSDRVRRVKSHILATRHAELPVDSDAKLVVDIDLSILGAPRARYAEFEEQVRREYKWVPGPLFRSKRAEILRSFSARPALYSHGPIRERFELPARANLEWAIAALER